MKHAEQLKSLSSAWVSAAELAYSHLAGRTEQLASDEAQAELYASIDAMQSALDDAVAKRDEYMGLWAALSQDEGKAERAVGELEAKLAARDAEMERLRKDAERLKRLEKYLKRCGLLEKKFCDPGVFIECSDWWLFWPVYSVDHTRGPLGYGDTETEAIDAALSEEVKGGE